MGHESSLGGNDLNIFEHQPNCFSTVNILLPLFATAAFPTQKKQLKPKSQKGIKRVYHLS